MTHAESAVSATDLRDLPATLDYVALAKDLDALRMEERDNRAEDREGPADLAHFQRLERWAKGLQAVGWATSWLGPNPVSILGLGLGHYGQWAVVAHHVSHRGLDRLPGAPDRYRKKVFASGARRLWDWPDWIAPGDWAVEHDELHHYYTNDWLDPDLVEENVHAIRDADWPMPVKAAVVSFFLATWKLTYYAPSAFLSTREVQRIREAKLPLDRHTFERPSRYYRVFDPRTEEGRAFWKRCLLPYGLSNFVAKPVLFAPLGPAAVASSVTNAVLGEIVTNLWAFGTIVPSHAGDDTLRFEKDPTSRGERYARQILSTVNYTLGDEGFVGDVHDYLHGFLNYQIEHHLFPDLAPRALRRVAPKVEAICAKHGLPYRKELVTKRIARTLKLMLGAISMPRERVEASEVEAATA